MKTVYEFKMSAVCPANLDVVDDYDVTVTFNGMLRVEHILDTVVFATKDPIYQENLTDALAKLLDATVSTVGVHSGVVTTCTCS